MDKAAGASTQAVWHSQRSTVYPLRTSQEANALDSVVVKQRRNEQSLVCSSPPEILQYIFDCYVEPDGPWEATGTYRRLPLPAILSHVCSRWRKACLNHRCLWASISFVICGPWAFEFIKRSGDAPLRVAFSLERKHGWHMARALLLAMHRVRYLEVEGKFDKLQAFCNALANSAAPILEHLSMNAEFPFSMQTRYVSAPSVFIPSTVLTHGAPRLQNLLLCRVQFQTSPMPAFSHLTHIQIRHSSSVADFWRLLQSVPHLKAMHCTKLSDQSHSPPWTDWPSESRRIHAPELDTLSVSEINLSTVVELLDALVAPSLLRLAFIEVGAATESDVVRYSAILPRVLSPHIKTLRGTHGPNQELLIERSCIGLRPGRLDCSWSNAFIGTSPLYIQWNWSTNYPEPPTEVFIRSILRTIHVDEVKTLFLSGIRSGPGDPYGRWTFLNSLRNVTALQTSGAWSTLKAIVPLMIPWQQRFYVDDSWLGTPQSELLFPLLAELVIPHTFIPERGGKLLRVLQHLARARNQEGKRLKIAFQDCNYSAAVMVELSKDAAVTWNGEWCPPFSFGGMGEDSELENWESWGSMFDLP